MKTYAIGKMPLLFSLIICTLPSLWLKVNPGLYQYNLCSTTTTTESMRPEFLQRNRENKNMDADFSFKWQFREFLLKKHLLCASYSARQASVLVKVPSDDFACETQGALLRI